MSGVRMVYFAWVRERIGRAEENLEPPKSVATLDQLLDWLVTLGPEYRLALGDRRAIRAAINQEHAGWDARLPDGCPDGFEVALFPPVTGG